ncbi:MAG TPA: Spy/CpxP family protein refolding chaperone [Syntrophomonadaceae bacterium]|nr:Spy/CpxP family protein refolding chaperone [Syntrophomonadaceae bacterium]
MKKRLILLTLSLALVLMSASAASAAGAGMNNGPSNSRFCPESNWVSLVEKLNLSDQQANQWKEINLRTYQAAKPIKAKLQDARFELKQMGLEKNADKAAINAKIKEINDLRAQLHKIRQQKREKVQSILTSEQQSQLKALRGFGKHEGRNCEGCKQLPVR